MNENALPLIGYPNNKSKKEKYKKELYVKLMTSEPCLFYENGSCKIYPYRPDGCRFYPLGRVERDLKTNEVLCPGRKRFDEIETNITQKYGTYKKTPYHKEIGEINIEYPPKDEQWEETLNNFNKSKPNQNEIKLFLKTNKRK
ncbi:hypothetical protein GF326_01900 [Candidatus Bathyarchaeota archaeon]|nr:hypothetical protein [Candidatus Bathyarchaeota archaeon]